MNSIRLLLLGLTTVLFVLSGCTTPESDSEDTRPSFPVKSIPKPDFNFDDFDRKRTIRAYGKLNAHALFELVIDREGNVVKIRVVRSVLDVEETAAFKVHVHHMRFTPAESNDPLPFRGLFYPLKTTTEILVR